MNCKTCGYRLWNLTSRNCPECGSAFAPSDFEFAPNQVQFCCPSCGQVYYGTSPTGHLIPPRFDCVQCGRHLHMDEMVLRPADWSREDLTAAQANPWLERARVGRFRAFFSTIGWAMARPSELLRVTPVQGATAQGWAYLVISFLIYSSIGFGPVAIFYGIMFAMFSPGGGAAGIGVVAGSIVGVLVALLVSVLGWLVYVAIWGAIAHLALLGGKPAGGVARTYQAICFTCGPMCVTAVPCLGVYMLPPVGAIWWLVSAILAVKEAQRVSGLRASIAMCIWPAIVMLTIAGLFTALIISASAAMSNISMQSSGGAAANTLQFAVMQHAASDPNGRGPTHAIELIGSQQWIDAGAFIDMSTGTVESDVPLLANLDLAQFDLATRAQQRTYTQQITQAQPANVVAHRVGDFVFTYHGADLTQPNPGLWLVVFSPDPAVNPTPAAAPTCVVALADGSMKSFPLSTMATELANQNVLRANLGLPPLPDPGTITHTQPAAATLPASSEP